LDGGDEDTLTEAKPMSLRAALNPKRYDWGVYLIHPPKVYRKEEGNEMGEINHLFSRSIIHAKDKSLKPERFYFEVTIKLTIL
jgi:hypothetical protein